MDVEVSGGRLCEMREGSINVRRHVWVLFGIVAVIAGCKTTDEVTGRGPLSLSSQMRSWVGQFEGKEGLVAVTYDGTSGYASYCPRVINCEGNSTPTSVVDYCEQRNGRKCGLYMVDGRVVWNSAATRVQTKSVDQSRAAKPFEYTDPAVLCRKALSPTAYNEWSTSPEALKFVAKAKWRRYSIETCRSALGL